MVNSIGGAVLRIKHDNSGVLSCIFASTTAPEFFGFPKDTDLTLSENFITLFNEEHRPHLLEALKTSGDTGSPIDFNMQIMHQDRGPVWVRFVGNAETGHDQTIICNLRGMEIEDRITISNELNRLERLLNLVVENIPFIVIVRDVKTSKIVFINRAGEETAGQSRDEIIGWRSARFRSGERNIWRQAARNKVIATGEPVFNPEQIIRSPVKGDRTVRTSDYPLNDEDGNLRFILSITEDVTDRNATEQALTRSENRFNAAIESFTDGLALFDSSDRLVLCNERYNAMWPRGDLDVKPGKTYPELVEAYARQAIEHGEEIDLQSYVKARVKSHLTPPSTREVALFDGRWLQVTDRRTEDGGIVVTCTDITSLKEKQAELKRTGEEALRAKETAELANKSKTDFLANMSHELRTPLNAVIGFSEIIRDAMMGREYIDDYQEYANDIHRSGSHLLALINDILDMSKIEAGELELIEDRVSLAEAIDISVKLVSERAAQNDVQLVTNIPPETPYLTADTRKIRQIIINLLSNAVKFSEPGGTVEINIEHSVDGDIMLAVIDGGIGIPADEVDQVLEPFKQAHTGLDRKFEGTGLGLSLTKSLTELHGGSLSLTSQTEGPNKGTTVRVTLPAARVITRPENA
jgi:two-component system cell cycle sensor histidine kinase PleC